MDRWRWTIADVGVYVDHENNIMNVMSMMMSRACDDDVRPSGRL